MFDWIPILFYTSIYYYIILIIVVVVVIYNILTTFDSNNNHKFLSIIGSTTLIFVLLYMGFRPVHEFFGDMTTYALIFDNYSYGATITSQKDVFFHVFTKYLSSIISVETYFFVCTLLYVIPLYLVSKKWFKEFWFYGFLFIITAFSFWSYGTNGIRNGIAGSLFLLGISRDKRIFQILLIILAINFHKTMLLPATGFVIANFYNNPKRMILFWVLCIPLSLLLGSNFESFVGSIGGFEDERLSYLTDGNINNDTFSSTGFRWDFLLYSATAIYAGWYYIVKKKYKNKIYYWLFNTYVFTNAFWILVIRANFSNRFAYLSWFMIGFVIIFPLLTKEMLKNQNQKIAVILLAYFMFTFFMNFI